MLRVAYDLCYNHTFGRLVDLERPSPERWPNERWPNERSDQNKRWLRPVVLSRCVLEYQFIHLFGFQNKKIIRWGMTSQLVFKIKFKNNFKTCLTESEDDALLTFFETTFCWSDTSFLQFFLPNPIDDTYLWNIGYIKLRVCQLINWISGATVTISGNSLVAYQFN